MEVARSPFPCHNGSYLLGDSEAATGFAELSLTICREPGDLLGEAYAMVTLGVCFRKLVRLEESASAFRQALKLR